MSAHSDAALHRLQASRASIDAELRKLQGFTDEDMTAPSADATSSSPSGHSTAALPWYGTLMRAVRLWWRRHPARPVLEIASSAGSHALKPLVRTHPVASLSLAMAAGAVMVVWRPWRSRLTAAVWAGLTAQLTAGLVRTVLNPGTLVALLGSLPAQRPAPPPDSSSTTAAQAPP
jgi:hypothetical protein